MRSPYKASTLFYYLGQLPDPRPVLSSRWLSAPLFLGIAVILAGCAGTATGLSSSSLSTASLGDPKTAANVQNNKSFKPVLVTLRFPSVVTPSAGPSLASKYARRFGLGADVNGDIYEGTLSAVTKTSYYVQGLYAALKEHLPANSIVLSPYEITQNSGGISNRNVRGVNLPPSILNVEFVAYHNPDASKVMEAKAITFGDIVTPLLVVRTTRQASPTTDGLLAASTLLLEEPNEPSGRAKAMPPAKISFIEFINRGQARVSNQLNVRDSGPLRNNAIVRLPLEKLQMDRQALQDSSRVGVLGPFANVVTPHVRMILAYLRNVDSEAVLATEFADWARYYDPSPGKTNLKGDDNKVGRRDKLLRSIYGLEKKFLARQSEKFHSAAYGQFGKSVRKTVLAEAALLGQRRDLAHQQNLNTALSIGSALFGGYAAYKADTTALTAAQTVMTWSEQQRQTAAQLSHSLGASFQRNYRQLYREQYQVTITTTDNEASVTSRTLKELRGKAKKIYQRNTSSGS